MKKLFFYCLVLIFCCELKAQDVSIPEGSFKDYLMSRYPGCFVNLDIDGRLMMNTACTAITSEDSLEFHQLDITFGPLDLEGIQYFTSLKYLNCSGNQIASVPALPASLISGYGKEYSMWM
jgi:hypothetical protein